MMTGTKDHVMTIGTKSHAMTDLTADQTTVMIDTTVQYGTEEIVITTAKTTFAEPHTF